MVDFRFVFVLWIVVFIFVVWGVCKVVKYLKFLVLWLFGSMFGVVFVYVGGVVVMGYDMMVWWLL